ncbi:MAG: sugar phosphate nucleotidyltransferase [Acidobacteria bacterium]|jgi:dTDP-glucose pyrophosphorylase|nr:sugar phosphate nucleotidyltransferase [Acidobacteriota bacterium]
MDTKNKISHEFLGVLCCGGRGTRLGEITRYISKCFVPVYDRPVFRFGLEMLENSRYIDEIIILTNDENDQKLRQNGHLTIVQDDLMTWDMFSGWEYIKRITGTRKHGVLMPSDNVSNIDIDKLIALFLQKQVNLAASLLKVTDRQKLSQMGCYDPVQKKYYYKHPAPPSQFGVVAPYIIHNSLEVNVNAKGGDYILNHPNSVFQEHKGYWFDVGDYESIIWASIFVSEQNTEQNKEDLNKED